MQDEDYVGRSAPAGESGKGLRSGAHLHAKTNDA